MEPILKFRELQKTVNNIKLSSVEIKIAVLGNHTTSFFLKALFNQLKLFGFKPLLFESEYNQIDMTLIDKKSKIYEFNPDIIIIFESSLKIIDKFYALKTDQERNDFNNTIVNLSKNRISYLKSNSNNAKIIYFSYELFDDQIYGNLFSKISHSFYNQLWKINNDLINLSNEIEDFYIFEINKYLRQASNIRDWAAFINSDLHYSIDTFTLLAHHITLFIKALKGSFNKCLILDLDNTLWGGIVGDDGFENLEIGDLGIGKAFTRLQKWAVELKNRGIIIAICSKNNEAIAKEPFIKNNEMVLKLEDISIFVANWKNKADNIRHIQEVLNVGFDSMVFIDDNPAERDIVKQSLPLVTVPELPEDPALYLPYLTSLNLFETASFSGNDKNRTLQYQQEAERKKSITSVTNMDDYLKSLEMEGVIEHFKIEDIPRIAQLTQRSNQFNLRTKRYTENDITRFMNSSKHLTYSVKLKDKFGNYGLVSAIILERKSNNEFFIDTWIMSCRVLKRGVEYFVLNKIVSDAEFYKFNLLTGEYLASKKNNLVSDLLDNLSFIKEKSSKLYKLNITYFKPKKNYIL